jgi:hypothetical protein
MRVQGCLDCEKLWQEYTEATFLFVRLDGRMKMAVLRQETELVQLQNQLEAAGARRDSALEQVKQHGATHGVAMAAG